MHTPLTPAAATISAHAPEPLPSVATVRDEVSNRDLLAELCDRAGCAVVKTYLQKPAHREVTYHAWGAAYPTSDRPSPTESGFPAHRSLGLARRVARLHLLSQSDACDSQLPGDVAVTRP